MYNLICFHVPPVFDAPFSKKKEEKRFFVNKMKNVSFRKITRDCGNLTFSLFKYKKTTIFSLKKEEFIRIRFSVSNLLVHVLFGRLETQASEHYLLWS